MKLRTWIRHLSALGLFLLILPVSVFAQVYLGMPKEELMFEIGRPTSTLSRPGMEILIYPNNVRIIMRDGVVSQVEGMDYLMERPGSAGIASSEPNARPVMEPVPGNPGSNSPAAAQDSIPSFPRDPNSIPPELQLSFEDQEKLEQQQVELEEELAEDLGTEWDDEEGWDAYEDWETEDSAGSGFVGGLIAFFVQVIITLIILKITMEITGVSAFIPGLLAIALIDSALRMVLEVIWLQMGWPFFGPVSVMITFFAMLYLVKGFTSASQWPTIIRVVVMTKVVSAVALWLLFMVGIFALG